MCGPDIKVKQRVGGIGACHTEIRALGPKEAQRRKEAVLKSIELNKEEKA